MNTLPCLLLLLMMTKYSLEEMGKLLSHYFGEKGNN